MIPILPEHLEAKGFYRKKQLGSNLNVFGHDDVVEMKVMEYRTQGGEYIYEPQFGALFFKKIKTTEDLEKFMFHVYANQS